MKNILLIITLLISWNAIAEEKIWYCSSEKSGGLHYENGKWILQKFTPSPRITIKQKKDKLIFPEAHKDLGLLSESTCVKGDVIGLIYCSYGLNTFALNPINGFASYAAYFGRIFGGESADSMVVSPWKCESF